MPATETSPITVAVAMTNRDRIAIRVALEAAIDGYRDNELAAEDRADAIHPEGDDEESIGRAECARADELSTASYWRRLRENAVAALAKIEDGGPAFPMSGDPNIDFDRGMSLRDYFAGQAMAGLMAHPDTNSGAWHVEATEAYRVADAMLAARAREGEAK